jgi:hypothetical protein
MKKSFDTALDIYLNCENFIRSISTQKTVCIDLKVNAIMYQSAPRMVIMVDSKIIYNDYLCEGENSILLNADLLSENSSIKIGMREKTSQDTLVNDEGQILADNAIEIIWLRLDGIDIIQDYDFFRTHITYFLHDTEDYVAPLLGFWQNGDLAIEFQSPLILWYNERSTKNTGVDDAMKYRNILSTKTLMQDFFDSLQKLRI